MASQPTTGSAPWSGAVVRVAGEVDCSTVPAMRAAFDQAWGDGKDELLVDLSGTTFMDCAGLTVLLQARSAWGGRLTLYRPPRSLRRILHALDMDDAFAIAEAVGADSVVTQHGPGSPNVRPSERA
jgi:anti-sigma B factor antagonist